MRKQLSRRQHIALGTGLLCVLALLQTSVAQGAARVTAAVGTALSGGDALEQLGALEDVADLETGDDGHCSLLVDQDALMELCGGTSVKLDRKEGQPDGPRIVRLDRGEIRMVVEPRLGEERIEIHTPAAIATLLGTVVHVSVDALGVTTITSAASRVLVESSDKSVPGSTTIDGGQQLVMAPGEPPAQQPTQVSPRRMASLGGCLIDFHAAALGEDRAASENRTIEEAVSEDIVDGDLPGVAADAGQSAMILENPVDPLTDPPISPDEQGYEGDDILPEPPDTDLLPDYPGGDLPDGPPIDVY
ncbi:MAG: FecR domain-containing protein [Deltaproteobacteria bacterium]|nr:FecR domain-containing protein [Deltaproteobacteria bacterium]